MIVSYTPCPVRTGVPGLGGSMTVPRPVLPVLMTGPVGYRLRDGLLDTGADETILDPSLAAQIGVDLSQSLQREVNLIGRGRIICSYARVQLRITDGVGETYEWEAMIGFAPFPLLRNLLGFAGFLQYFDATFCGANQNVILHPNASFAGRSP